MPDASHRKKKTSITVSHLYETVYEKSVSAKVRRSPRWFGKSPATVLLDNSLSDLAVRVYGTMGLKTEEGSCSVGVRYLARILNSSSATIARKIAELVDAGHLKRLPQDNGARAVFQFTSPAHYRICQSCRRYSALGIDHLCWVCRELRERAVSA
jgi:DNA-binding MarR family transcriptional regulator